MTELKRCPFCGCEATYYYRRGRYSFFAVAQCKVCKASTRPVSISSDGPENDGFFDDDAFYEVGELWNTRKDEAK